MLSVQENVSVRLQPKSGAPMSLRKPLPIIALLSLAALAACADVTGPESDGFCAITGGPGTCMTTQK